VLRAVVKEPSDFNDEKSRNAEARVRRALQAFACEHPLLHQEFIRVLHGFSARRDLRDSKGALEPATTSKMAVNLPAEYPKEVNEILYAVLRAYQKCTCLDPENEAGSKRHLARLRLKTIHDLANDGSVYFDMLFSASLAPLSHAHTVYWQDIQLHVPRYRNNIAFHYLKNLTNGDLHI
jgi:hypothetical protein